MQTFKDSVTGKVWQFEDNVIVTNTNDVYSFTASYGMALNTPTTLQPYTIPSPTTAQLLQAAKTAQLAVLQSGYQSAINIPVSFKNAAGVTSTYAFGNTITPGGSNAQSLLTQIISTGSSAWRAGVWFDTNGVAQTMTFADLQGLASAVEAMETPDEQDLMTKISEMQSATTISAVQAIVF